MSRAQRRSTRGSAKSAPRNRRTPAKAQTSGLNIPWIPIGIVFGLVAVVGLVGYLIWQANKPAGVANAEARRIEADANPDLPGEFVNLPKIYKVEGYSKTASHVQTDVDYEGDQGLPPVGGPHWGTGGGCPPDPATAPPFCGPVPAGFYDDPNDAWPAESLVHNMEHAGVVVWYNTDDQKVIDDLQDFAHDNGRGRSGNDVTAYFPDLPKDTVAITGWSRRLIMPVSKYDRDALKTFYNKYECHFDPENLC